MNVGKIYIIYIKSESVVQREANDGALISPKERVLKANVDLWIETRYRPIVALYKSRAA